VLLLDPLVRGNDDSALVVRHVLRDASTHQRLLEPLRIHTRAAALRRTVESSLRILAGLPEPIASVLTGSTNSIPRSLAGVPEPIARRRGALSDSIACSLQGALDSPDLRVHDGNRLGQDVDHLRAHPHDVLDR